MGTKPDAFPPTNRQPTGSHDNDDNNHQPVNMEGVDCTGADAVFPGTDRYYMEGGIS